VTALRIEGTIDSTTDKRAITTANQDLRLQEPEATQHLLHIKPFVWASGGENARGISPFLDVVSFADVVGNQVQR